MINTNVPNNQINEPRLSDEELKKLRDIFDYDLFEFKEYKNILIALYLIIIGVSILFIILFGILF